MIYKYVYPFPAAACPKKGQKMTCRVPKLEFISIAFLKQKIIWNLVSSLKKLGTEKPKKTG